MQLDLEMSFATGEDVMRSIETLVRKLWRELLQADTIPEIFPRISYQEAMSMYGSDKPYMKLGMQVRSPQKKMYIQAKPALTI